MSGKKLGNVLVVGGCGFLGHHIVKVLLEDPDTDEVHILSRRPDINRFPSAHYHAGDITSPNAVKDCLQRAQPRVLIHTASPDPFADPPNPSNYYKINVDGTANLLACAKESPSVVAFVYTSSTTVTINNTNGECFMAKEEAPIFQGPYRPGINPYYSSKGEADEMVRAANCPSGSPTELLRTGCVRCAPTYGEGDATNMTWQGIELAKQGKAFLQFGDNTTLYDPVYAGNAADLHVLLAKALVRGPNENAHKVDGEAFNVTDDAPLPFWTFTRQLFAAAGVHQPVDKVWVIPTPLIFLLASITEWIFWILFWGQRRPKHLLPEKIEYLCKTRTWSVEKAKERLGWRPKFTMDEGIRRGTGWAMEKWEQEQKAKKWKWI